MPIQERISACVFNPICKEPQNSLRGWHDRKRDGALPACRRMIPARRTVLVVRRKLSSGRRSQRRPSSPSGVDKVTAVRPLIPDHFVLMNWTACASSQRSPGFNPLATSIYKSGPRPVDGQRRRPRRQPRLLVGVLLRCVRCRSFRRSQSRRRLRCRDSEPYFLFGMSE